MANARLAGFTYLFYIAVAFPSMMLFARATSGAGMAAKLASMVQHPAGVRAAAVLRLLGCLCALVLAVTLYAITRDQDRDLAMLGLTCRVAEGIIGAASIPASFGLLSIAIASGANAPDPSAAQAIGAFVLGQPELIGGWFFAVGSTLFSWLLLRGRTIPVPLAWLGVVASALLVVGLPLAFGRVISGTITQLIWFPMAAFEIPLGFWLLIKGVPSPEASVSPHGR